MDTVKIKDIWESIRFKQDNVPWFQAVCPSLRVERYAFHSWILCHDRLPTLARLSCFGIAMDLQCFLCVRGLETIEHLFLKWTYSSFLLQVLMSHIHVQLPATSTWPELLSHLLNLDSDQSRVAVLIAQEFAYHIWREKR